MSGGGVRPKILPITYGARDPPHGVNGLYVQRKDCPHRKNTPIGDTPPPTWNLFIQILEVLPIILTTYLPV